MKNRGITLIELLVVIAVVGVLVIAMGFSYVGWMGRYKVESTMKELYSDLMDARGRAMQGTRDYFADFNLPAPPAGFGRYRIIQDTNDNGTSQPGAGDTIQPTFPKTVKYAINWDGGGTIKFDKRGVVSPNGTIFLTLPAGVDPDYDCICIACTSTAGTTFSTRINLGKMTGGACNVK